MKIQNVLITLFLFVMIAISIYFSSSPFSIKQDYNCINALIDEQMIRVCGTADRPDNLQPVAIVLSTLPYSTEPSTPNSLAIVFEGNNSCGYRDEITCFGNSVNNGRVGGLQYILKQDYQNDRANCDVPQNITYYYTDCTTNDGVCQYNRCVKNKYQSFFYRVMELLGFRP